MDMSSTSALNVMFFLYQRDDIDTFGVPLWWLEDAFPISSQNLNEYQVRIIEVWLRYTKHGPHTQPLTSLIFELTKDNAEC